MNSFTPLNADEYKRLEDLAIKDPEKFAKTVATEILEWTCSDFTSIIGKIGDENSFWFEGGELNVCYNALDRHAKKNPDKIALLYLGNTDEKMEITYQQLLVRVQKMSRVLLNENVKKGTVVVLYMPLCIEAVVVMLACARIGAIHSVIFSAFTGDALAYRVNNSNAELFITVHSYQRASKTIEMYKNVCGQVPSFQNIKTILVADVMNKERDLTPVEGVEVKSLTKLVDEAEPFTECVTMKASDPLFMLYTSGSTGNAKGVIHRCGGYAFATCLTYKFVFDTNEDTIFGCTSDIGWITGHSYVVYGPLLNGNTTLIFGGSPLYPNPMRSFEMIQDLKLTHFYTAPSAARAIKHGLSKMHGDNALQAVRKLDISTLRIVGSVGETLDEETYHFLKEYYCEGDKRWIVDTYWQTELGSIIATSIPGISVNEPGVVGRPLFGTELVIVDQNDHRVLASTSSPPPSENHTGILCVKSPWPSLTNTSYKSEKSFHDTYIIAGNLFSTGDIAQIDSKGRIRITGRSDDQLCVNGHRIGPNEVEQCILKIDKFYEAAVIGIPSPISGQDIVAIVVTDYDQETATKKVIENVTKYFGPTGRPKKVVKVTDVPKNNSGKIVRAFIRQKYLNKDAPAPILANPDSIDDLTRAFHS